MARIVHGKIKTKGNPDKLIAIGVLEKQLYREKTVMKGMFPPHKVHDPPDEYKFEDVNVIPLDKSQDHGGSERGRKGRPKMHVPNWGNQQASYQPTTVFDNRFFWVKIEHTVREEDDDPMAPFTGLCDRCSVNKDLDRDECDINKNYDPNCSANYTLRSLEEPQKERT